MAKVDLENVFKVYDGGVRAVNEFNLNIKDKEFIVFVGPSGCGKSTTLRMIAGLENITQGGLYIDDKLVNDVDSKNRDIAMVFQNYALYPHMTVYQNMAFGLKLRHFKKEDIDVRVKKAAEILEISDLLTRKPKALSGGQRQRVALGRAIVREPKVFLLDEPLSNLDAKLRVQMRSEIAKLHNKLQTTFIYVTHDQTEAMTMGSRIVVMKDGYIQQVDSPIALFEDPANLFVATFLGSPQMNILNAKLIKEKTKEQEKILIKLVDTSAGILLPISETKAKQLSSDFNYEDEVHFGIRPESIKVDENGKIPAIIEVVEQLGDETILYCKIDGIKQNIIVKSPFQGRVETNKSIKLNFDMERVHLFDKKTTSSILGIRKENSFSCKISNEKIEIGNKEFKLPEYLEKRLLDRAFNCPLKMRVDVNSISLSYVEKSFKLPIKIEFTEQKTDYIAAYFRIKGLDDFFVLKMPLDINNVVKEIYVPYDKICFVNEKNEILLSREEILPIETNGQIKISGQEAIVNCFGTKFVIPNKNYKNGSCVVKIKPEGPNAIFNKKLNKENPDHNKNLSMKNRILFLAYDEFKAKDNNFIYGKIPGLKNYATFYVKNDFSVYKMDKFKVDIPVDCIEILQ